MSGNDENTIFDLKSKNQVLSSMYVERIAIPITENQKILQESCLDVFEDYVTNKITRQSYRKGLFRFMRHFRLTKPSYLLECPEDELSNMLKQYIRHLKERCEKGEIKVNVIKNYLFGVKFFLDYNDRLLNFKKIFKMIPERTSLSGQKAYAIEEIRELVNTQKNVRNKLTFLLMTSVGLRTGAIPIMKLKHIEKIENCYWIRIYPDSKDEYIGYMTPECSRTYERYLQQRKNNGEVLTGESPLILADHKEGEIQAITKQGLYQLVTRQINNLGLRGDKVGNRYEKMASHGFRKFFATQIKKSQLISYSTSERLLGHATNMDINYYRPEHEELFQEFKKIIPLITIDILHLKEIEIQNLMQEKTELEKEREIKQALEDKVARQEQVLARVLNRLKELEGY